MILRRTLTIFFFIIVTTIIASCTSSDDNTTDNSSSDNSIAAPDAVRFLGIVSANSLERQQNMLMQPVFFQYSENISVDLLKKVMIKVDTNSLTIPFCTVQPVGAPEGGPFIPDEIEVQTVSAGDNLVLTSPSGTFATIDKIESGILSPSYAVTTADLPFYPASTQLSIPGDVFPAMDVPLPTVDKLESAIFSEERPTRVTEEFTWTPSADENAIVQLSFADDPQENWITCYSPDSGTFVFPENVISQFNADQPMLMLNMARQKTTIHYTDNAMLITSIITRITDR